MKQTHNAVCEVDGGIDSHAYWALQPNGHLLVFVHGFMGSAAKTWVDFPGQLMIHPECSGIDLVFYGYDSLQRADRSARDFNQFLNKLLSPTFRLINDSLERGSFNRRKVGEFEPKRVTILAHSLGACVARRALIQQIRNVRRDWPTTLELMFFAPAHKGAKILQLFVEASFGVPLAAPVAAVVRNFIIPVTRDLKVGSDFLRDLEIDTRDCVDDGEEQLRARLVLSAEKDNVVEDLTFAYDPLALLAKGETHTSVCKPHASKTFVVRKVLKEL